MNSTGSALWLISLLAGSVAAAPPRFGARPPAAVKPAAARPQSPAAVPRAGRAALPAADLHGGLPAAAPARPASAADEARAAALARPEAAGRFFDAARTIEAPREEQAFGRMFPRLPRREPKAGPAAEALGGKGGPMDGAATVRPNAAVPAGFTYLGQFIDHDITLDTASKLGGLNRPDRLQNRRTPALDLDSLYAGGPAVSPHLYDKANPAKFLLGPSESEQTDLPRNRQGRALIGDPRNDENLIVSQLHLAFLRFHNKVVDLVGDFEKARELVTRHYQWIVVNEFLPLTVGQGVVDAVLKRGRRFYKWKQRPFMPVEFSAAAYRFGHSQVLPGYRINDRFAARLFPDPDNPAAESLMGDRPVPKEHAVDWSNFFVLKKDKAPQPSNLIDAEIPGSLVHLPDSVVGPGTPAALRSLAVRNIKRGDAMGLPSGQRVAARMGLRSLDDDQLWGSARAKGLPVVKDAPAPLWYYVLREAEVLAGGRTLGPVGARIVAEVFIGLLQGDPASYLNAPGWKPTLPGEKPGLFTMADLLRFIEEPPAPLLPLA